MKLKKVKRYVKYRTNNGIVVIEDTHEDSNYVGRVYKKDQSNNFYEGILCYGRVRYWTLIGTVLEESDTLE